MKTLRLPDTDSIDELARFWDTHDLTDFEDQLDEIAEPVFRYGQKGINVPLAPDEIEAAERVARSEGSDLAGLLHGWIVEKLNEVLRSRQPSQAK
jgi:hypothetical protein